MMSSTTAVYTVGIFSFLFCMPSSLPPSYGYQCCFCEEEKKSEKVWHPVFVFDARHWKKRRRRTTTSSELSFFFLFFSLSLSHSLSLFFPFSSSRLNISTLRGKYEESEHIWIERHVSRHRPRLIGLWVLLSWWCHCSEVTISLTFSFQIFLRVHFYFFLFLSFFLSPLSISFPLEHGFSIGWGNWLIDGRGSHR